MEKLANFRDLGGMKTADGRTVKKNRLLRSGQIVDISARDKAVLANEYRLKLIIDLRGKEEAAQAPDDAVGEAAYLNVRLHADGDEERYAPGSREFSGVRSESMLISYMLKVYEHMATSRGALNGFKRFLDLLRDNETGSVIFHCFAGKDRTGVAAAMVYTILGVKKDDIIEEYLLTNILRKATDEAVFASMKARGMDESQIGVVRLAYQVRPEYLGRVFEIAETRHGCMLGFLKEDVGVTDEDIQRFRRNYLV